MAVRMVAAVEGVGNLEHDVVSHVHASDTVPLPSGASSEALQRSRCSPTPPLRPLTPHSTRRRFLLQLCFLLFLLLHLGAADTSSSGGDVHRRPHLLKRRPFILFAQATAYTNTNSYSLTSYTTSMCPSTHPSLATSTRVQYANTCPFYDLYYILSTSSSTAMSVHTSVQASSEEEREKVPLDDNTGPVGAGANVVDAPPAATAVSSTATVAATSSFSSIFKGPRSTLAFFYMELMTDPFFYMLQDCTIVIEISSALVPSYSANNFQTYVNAYRLQQQQAASSSSQTAWDLRSTPVKETAVEGVTTRHLQEANEQEEKGKREIKRTAQAADISKATSVAAAAATTTTTEVYPDISLRTTFFYWNQPRLHCLLNAPVLMAMRALAKPAATSSTSCVQLPLDSTATSASGIETTTATAAAAAVAAEPQVRRGDRAMPRASQTKAGVCRVPSAPSPYLRLSEVSHATSAAAATTASASAASSFASCAAYVPDPSTLLPPISTNALLTANYMQLSSNIVLKVFSYDVWYQLANPSADASGPWLTAWQLIKTYYARPEARRRFTANFSSVPSSPSHASNAAAATADPLKPMFEDREEAYDNLGYNLAVDPARVCTAPALYTVSLDALLADSASWGLGTSGDWLQSNVTVRHRYPSARAVAVVVQCSGVPLSFSVTATFTNSLARPGSGQNYYTSIIYFLFLVCYALLVIIFLVLIVPCGKRRQREREMKEKDEEAEKKKKKQQHAQKNDKRRAPRRHKHRRHRSGSKNRRSSSSSGSNSSSAATSGAGSEGGEGRVRHWQSHSKASPSSFRRHGKGSKRAPTATTTASDEPAHGEAGKRKKGKPSRDVHSPKGSAKERRQRATTARDGGREREEVEVSSLHSLHSNMSFTSSSSSSDIAAASVRSDAERDVTVVRRRGDAPRKGESKESAAQPQQQQQQQRRHGTTRQGSSRIRRGQRSSRSLSSSSDDDDDDRSDDGESYGSSSSTGNETSSSSSFSDGERLRHRDSGRGDRSRTARRRRRERRASSVSSAGDGTASSDRTRSTGNGSSGDDDSDNDNSSERDARRHSRRRSRRRASPEQRTTRSQQRGLTDMLALLCCGVGVRDTVDNYSDDDDNNERVGGRRSQPVFNRRAFTAVVDFFKAAHATVMDKVVSPLERWWKESYILIMYAPVQWLVLVLLVLKVLLCTLYSAKFSLMAETSFGSTSSSFSLFVVCVIFEITADTLLITLEMLVSMGWGLAFTSPLPTNQIVIVCLATIGMFIDYVFQATCDTDGYNLAYTVNPFARLENTKRCNSVMYSRIALELACRVHNVLRMFLLMLWLGRTVVPADAAAVQRQRRLRERQVRKDRQHQHQLRNADGSGGEGNNGGSRSSSSSSSSSSSAAAAAAAAASSPTASTRRGNGLTSNPSPMPPPPITLSPPPRLDYRGTTLSAMDVYMRYQSMWAPFGMLLVWYLLSIIFSFTFFQPEDYYMVVVFREFQTLYLIAFIVFFLRVSSPQYI